MSPNFRNIAPKRNYTGSEQPYDKHKAQLAADFNSRCGYTNCQDIFLGGKDSFQIDHFKSQLKYPHLRNEYSNLVYCCMFVNRAKSDDDSPKYLDPCETDYNLHFKRDKQGYIMPLAHSVPAQYMYRKLKLYMRRYALVWTLEQIFMKMELLKTKIEGMKEGALRNELLILQGELANLYIDYVRQL